MENYARQLWQTKKRTAMSIPTVDHPSRQKQRMSDVSPRYSQDLFYGEGPGENQNFPLAMLIKVFQKCHFCEKKGMNICSHTHNDSYKSSRIILSKYLDENAGGYCLLDLSNSLMQSTCPIPDILKEAFIAVDVPHDNNCGYHALSMTLKLTTYYSKFLRRALYLFAKLNPDVLSKISKDDKIREDKFMRDLVQDGVWLDVWGLLIAAEFLSRKIIVYQKNSLANDINGTTYAPSTDLYPEKPL